MSNKLRVLSLFSGVGAFEQALSNLNHPHEVINYCEINKFSSKAYSLLHDVDESLNLIDITKINPSQLPDFDLLTHGSPCQSFSVIGTQEGGDKGSGTKSSLMWYTVDIIKEKRPKYVIWENVKNVLGKSHIHNFDAYIHELDKLGYTSYHQVLNSLDYGSAQNRERLFVISILGEHTPFIFPKKQDRVHTIGEILEDNVNEKYIVPHHCVIGYQNKKSIFRNRFTLKSPQDHAYCLVAKGGRAVITNNYIFNDLSMYDNPPCKLNDLDYIADNNIPIRALTPKEYWRLQGFTDNQFSKVDGKISDNQLYTQAGNSITVSVIQAIFEQLFKKHDSVIEREIQLKWEVI